MSEKKTDIWIDINGSVNVDVDHDKFLNEFVLWLEGKGWSFAGLTKESEDEVDKEWKKRDEDSEEEE